MYNESIRRNPLDPLAYTRIGNVYLTEADAIEQSIANKKVSAADAKSLRTKEGELLANAEKSFKQAIQINNSFGQALYNLGVVYEHRGQLKESIEQFKRLAGLNPSDPSLIFQLGLLYYRNNQKDLAFNSLLQAVALFPDYSNARWYLSLMYEERGQLDQALVQAKAIQKLNPDNDMVKQRIDQLESGKRLIPPSNVLDQEPL
jgi:tetratricopeptide (TPR) repeat protein